MRKLLTFTCALLLSLASSIMADAGKCQIFIKGKQISAADYSIAIPENATASEQFAAQELSRYLEQMTGEKLEVLSETAEGKASKIYVGKCQNLPVKVDFGKLGTDGIHMQNKGNDLVLAGNLRGVQYAVYSFLEEKLNCRWFAADCIVIPDNGTFKLSNFKKVFVPELEYRDTDYPSRKPPVFATPNKYNGKYGTAEEKWGANISYFGFVHTFEHIVPPSVYGKTHPEYFSEIEGERIPEGTQLCLTNDEVKKIAAEYILNAMRKHPECTIFSVSQNDRHKYCECAKCTELAEKEGSQCGPLIHFVNYVADAVKDEFPDKIVDTLAYQYTRKAPKYVKPRPNVAIRLCDIECCFSHALDKCPENKSFVDDIVAWSKLTNRLHIWDYVINYRHVLAPFPNFRVILPNIKFFIKHGVTGIYEEANYFSKGGELAELRSYVMAKCLWDTNQDVDKLIKEFTDAYYGAAAPMIRAYINNMHDTVCKKQNSHIRINTQLADFLYDAALLDKSEDYFQKAEAAVANDPVRLHRVKVAHLGIQYSLITLSSSLLKKEGDQLVPTIKISPEMAKAVHDTIWAENITHLSEGGANAKPWSKSLTAKTQPMKVCTIANDQMSVDVIPCFGGRIWRAKYLPTGKDIILVNGNDQNGFTIGDNGYEEYSGPGYREAGYSENYEVVEATASYVVMRGVLANGCTITRRIEVLPGKAAFKVSSKLTTAKPVANKVLRVHPAFYTNAPTSTMFYKKVDGTWGEKSLLDKKAPMAEYDFWMKNDRRPAGQWAILDTKDNLVLLDTFNNDTVDYCYLNWRGAIFRVNLEEWSKPVNADKQNGPVLENTYEILPLDKAPWNNK